jgi:hypothetical protein
VVNRRRVFLSLALLATLFLCNHPAFSQNLAEQFFSHNSNMAKKQPAFITPLIASDPRLLQYVRASFSHQYTASGTETVSYGNARGGGVIVGDRFEFDFVPPAYIQHNSSAVDGLGDITVLGKYRIASGDRESGNYALSAMLAHTFATGTYKNGATTDSFAPTLAGGYAFFRRFDAVSSLGGTLPTGNIAHQGRSIAWNSTLQTRATRALWFEVEDNATWYVGGPHQGRMQNFLTPAAFYVVRPKNWRPAHPFFILDSGMQIASSGYHSYNHNLISEVRMLF